MKVTHRMDDSYIERAWKRAETSEIEKLANELTEKAQAQGVDPIETFELDLSRLLYLAFRCGFKAAM